MIWELFFGFLRVGCFAFGGAYGAIPLIREVVLKHGWLTDESLTYLIGVSESTPGPIMVNLATYIGSLEAGLPGALLATVAVVLPSFLVILAVTALLESFLKKGWVQALLRGLKPCLTGIILATGCYMIWQSCFSLQPGFQIQPRPLLLTCILAGTMAVFPKLRHKKLSPISLILLSCVLGIVAYGV